MKRLSTIKEIKELYGKRYIQVFCNWYQVNNGLSDNAAVAETLKYYGEENVFKFGDGWKPRRYLKIEKIYNMGNGYYMLLNTHDNTITIIKILD